MFCPNCGSRVDDNASQFCPNCGANLKTGAAPVNQAAPQQAAPVAQNQSNESNAIAIVGFIFSFFGGILGLVCSIIGYQNAKKGAPYKNLALAGIIISIVVMAGSFLIAIIVSAAIAAAASELYAVAALSAALL